MIAGKAVRRPLLTARTYLCVHAHAWLHVLLLPARVNRHACMHLHLSGRQPGQGIHARTGRHRLCPIGNWGFPFHTPCHASSSQRAFPGFRQTMRWGIRGMVDADDPRGRVGCAATRCMVVVGSNELARWRSNP